MANLLYDEGHRGAESPERVIESLRLRRNYLCACYKSFFRHVGPYMRFMAAELAAQRPPANVMRWVAATDARAAMTKAGRNDSCPCGSGRKFKHCCGAA